MMKYRKQKPEIYTSDILDEIFKEITPEEMEKSKNKMLLAAKIDEAIKAKGWKKKDFASALNKQPSEITKWLSGNHNFTADTLWEIEKVLNIELINLNIGEAEEIANFRATATQKINSTQQVNAFNLFYLDFLTSNKDGLISNSNRYRA
jgi:transcriptional regulator with XRE-family HTH domain